VIIYFYAPKGAVVQIFLKRGRATKKKKIIPLNEKTSHNKNKAGFLSVSNLFVD